MDSNRVNLDAKNKTTYIVLSIILLILSTVGILLFFQIIKTRNQENIEDNSNKYVSNPTSVPTITAVPTQASPSAKLSPTAKPTTATSSAKLTPTVKPTLTPKPTTTIIVTPTLAPSVTPVSGVLIDYNNSTDKFSVSYKSTRKFYQDTESSGNRYTFTNPSGNFAIHVSDSGTWSWIHPDRNFSSAFTVAGQNTFRYDISTQTIVDLQSSDKNYTIQCVHNGAASLKTECEEFLKSFKFL